MKVINIIPNLIQLQQCHLFSENSLCFVLCEWAYTIYVQNEWQFSFPYSFIYYYVVDICHYILEKS